MKRLFDLLKLMINMIKSCVKTVNGVLPDENGDVKIEVGGGLPSGGEPHQMIVTDADGKTVWEEKLCYEEGMQFKWDGDLTGRKTVDANGKTYVRVGDYLESDKLHGATMHVSGWRQLAEWLELPTDMQQDTQTITSDMIALADDSAYSVTFQVLPVIIGIPNGVTSFEGVDGFETGIYVLYAPEGATLGDIVFPAAIFADVIDAQYVVKQIPDKYIPNNVSKQIEFNLSFGNDGSIVADITIEELFSYVSIGYSAQARLNKFLLKLTSTSINSGGTPIFAFVGIDGIYCVAVQGYHSASKDVDVWDYIKNGAPLLYNDGSVNELMLRSNANGKVYSVTVDDSGTLTATEVTD